MRQYVWIALALAVGACDSSPTEPEPTTVTIEQAPPPVMDSVCVTATFGAGGRTCLRWRYFPVDGS